MNQQSVLSQCSELAKPEFREMGYDLCSLDAGWSTNDVDEYGRIQYNNGTFDLPQLARQLHGMGLKLGVYVIPGVPCGAANGTIKGTNILIGDVPNGNKDGLAYCDWDFSKEGIQHWHDSLIELWASWGVDMIKFDFVTPGSPWNGANLVCKHTATVEAYHNVIANSGHQIRLDLSWNLCRNETYPPVWSERTITIERMENCGKMLGGLSAQLPTIEWSLDGAILGVTSMVFTPALGETLAVGKSSLILSATSAGPVELFAQIGDIDSAFKPVDVECLSGGLQTYQVSLDTDCCSPQDPTEVSIFHHANGGRQLLGKISLVQYQEPKPLRLQFCTTILLDEEDEFKSQRLEWLEHDQWEGWVWYRPRDTWIEASFTSLREISSQSPIHSLLLRSTPRSAHPQSVLAVFPASTAAAFVNLSAAGPGEVPGIYARVRRVKQGGKAEIVVTGDLRHHNGTVAAIPGAIDQARKQYGLSTAPFQTDADSGNPFNSLGFCTWSSIGENVPLTYELMKNLVESLRRDNAPISTFIVDDGWQDIRKGHNGSAGSRGLWSFGTWPGMGCTLSETVDLIKDTLPTVRDVGVWMTLYGYWNSIAPDSPLTKKYEMRSFHLNQDRVPGILRPPGASDSQQLCCSTDPKDHVYCLPPKNRAYDFWKDYFAFCAAAGVSFVKVDNQAYGSYLDGVEGGEEFVAMWNGMVNAANTVFGENRVIHCMAHYERMFNGDIGLGAATNGKKIVIRNSDDFGLHRPNVHRDHVLYNIYNALLTSNLCFVPDADMFMTSAQWPDYHATLRAFFDGPVLLADKPGSHDPRILGKMIGLSPQNGRYEVIKPERAIRPLGRNVWERFLAAGVGPALKGASYFPDCGSANIVLWNCRAGACDDAVDLILTEDLADALELSTGSESVDLAVWASNAEKARSMTVNTSTAENASSLVISTRLPPKAVEVLTIAPYHALGGISIANLGLIDKYAGLVSIGNSEVSGTRLSTKIRHQGILGFLVSRFVDGESDLRVTVDGRAVHFTVERQSKELHLVQVDLSKASPSLRKDHYAVDIGFW